MPDTDLEVGGGGGHLDPEIRGGGQSPKKCFSALRASVWSKNKWGEGGRGGGRAPLLDLPLIREGYLIKT